MFNAVVLILLFALGGGAMGVVWYYLLTKPCCMMCGRIKCDCYANRQIRSEYKTSGSASRGTS